MLPIRRGTFGGETQAADLLIDLDDLFEDKVHSNLGPRRRSMRPRFHDARLVLMLVLDQWMITSGILIFSGT